MFGFNKMVIELKKIGTTLISRQTGKEAFLAIQPILQNIKDGQKLEINFEGVMTFSPSWGAEFLMPLFKNYGQDLILKNTHNGSVQSTFDGLNYSTRSLLIFQASPLVSYDKS
jgi:hypothetical protein